MSAAVHQPLARSLTRPPLASRWIGAIVAAVWTLSIAIGSILKDRWRLRVIGELYRQYQARVPGYSGMPAGPLARIPLPIDFT